MDKTCLQRKSELLFLIQYKCFEKQHTEKVPFNETNVKIAGAVGGYRKSEYLFYEMVSNGCIIVCQFL